jgi:hypothetical protein
LRDTRGDGSLMTAIEGGGFYVGLKQDRGDSVKHMAKPVFSNVTMSCYNNFHKQGGQKCQSFQQKA